MTVGMEKCKRIVEYFWDPEPKNDEPATAIWCLGREYASQAINNPSGGTDANVPKGASWPKEFISDFGSRVWITYRSGFIPIPRTNTPEATSAMTLGVRLRSQLMDSQGFTSDTGWGCMIRSGQSLLANTCSILRLGRGERHAIMFEIPAHSPYQTGGAGKKWRRNPNYSPCSPITQRLHSRYIVL